MTEAMVKIFGYLVCYVTLINMLHKRQISYTNFWHIRTGSDAIMATPKVVDYSKCVSLYMSQLSISVMHVRTRCASMFMKM